MYLKTNNNGRIKAKTSKGLTAIVLLILSFTITFLLAVLLIALSALISRNGVSNEKLLPLSLFVWLILVTLPAYKTIKSQSYFMSYIQKVYKPVPPISPLIQLQSKTLKLYNPLSLFNSVWKAWKVIWTKQDDIEVEKLRNILINNYRLTIFVICFGFLLLLTINLFLAY